MLLHVSGHFHTRSMISGVIICLLLCSAISITETVVIQIAKIAQEAYSVISAGIEFVEKIVSGDPFSQIQASLQELRRSINIIHTKLDYLTGLVEELLQRVKELPYNLRITQHVEKIKSCTDDLNNFMSKPTNTAARENLEKCYNIMENVRSIGNYLSGGVIAGSPPIFDLYRQKQGTYDGVTIQNMFTYMYTHFINGCAIVVTAEGLKYLMSASLYHNECKAKVGAIHSYMKNFFSKCIREMCPVFVSAAKGKLSKVYDSSSAHTALSDAFPWFQFLALQTRSTKPDVTDVGTFKMKSHTIASTQTYQLFWTDIFVRLQRIGPGMKINITVNRNELASSFYGNVNLTTNVKESSMQFIAYTSDTSIDHCDYNTGVNSAQSSRLDLPMCFFVIILSFFCLSILKLG